MRQTWRDTNFLGRRVNQLSRLSVLLMTRRYMSVPSGDCRELASQGADWGTLGGVCLAGPTLGPSSRRACLLSSPFHPRCAASASALSKENLKLPRRGTLIMSGTGLLPQSALARRSVIGLVLAVLLSLLFVVDVQPAAAAGPCGPPVTSVIACENTKPGDPTSDWQVSGSGDAAIQGFATSMSVQPGQSISFKINTTATKYHIDILRVGYYQGM